MKNKLPLAIAIATVLGAPALYAQDDRKPDAPPAPPPSPDAKQPGNPPPPPAPNDGGNRPAPPQGGPGDHHPDGRSEGRNDGHGEGRGEGHGPHHQDGERPFAGHGDGMGRGEGMTHGEGPGHGMMPPIPQHPRPFIGVITSPVPPVLASQLGLSDGFGVVVEDVLPEGPAAKAGVQKFDVLKDLNDQHLIDPGQLAALLHSYGKDADVTLTVLRKGQEQKLTMKVAERMFPERGQAPMPFGEFRHHLDPAGTIGNAGAAGGPGGEEQFRRMQENMRGFQEKMNEFQHRIQAWSKDPTSGPPPEAPRFEPQNGPGGPQGAPHRPEPPRPTDLLRQMRPGGAPQVRVDQDGNVTTWSTGNARVVVKDGGGEVEVQSTDGHRIVVAKGPSGETVFTGPVDTEEQRAALPPPVRAKLDEIQLQSSSSPATAAAEVDSLEKALKATPSPEREVQ